MSATHEPKKQEERSILINFVLDKSGSMDAIREATISGFNEFLGDQQREGGLAVMTLTLFDTHFQTVARAVPVAQMAALRPDSYVPGGQTALYDAIAHTMRITDDYVAEHKPDQVLFVIMTDGQENASREFDRRAILAMIEERQKAPAYEFIYLGANQDAYAVGAGMGIRGGRALGYVASPAAACETMARISHNVRALRRTGEATMRDDVFFSPEFEKLGATTWEEYRQQRDQRSGPDAHPTDDHSTGDRDPGQEPAPKEGTE
jgi:uncharacterized protein YegL